MNDEGDNTREVLEGSPALKHSALTGKIIAAFYEVYNELGFLESVYRNALASALRKHGMTAEREVPIAVWYEGVDVGDFKADLIVDRTVLLELKTAQTLDRAHEAQLLNYLRATEIELGLLLDFGPKPQFKRLILTNDQKKIRVHPCESVVGQ